MQTEKVRWVRGTVSVISALRLGTSVTAFPAPCPSSLLGFVGGAMRRLFILPALALLAACGSGPTSATCTRADLGSACSEPSSAEQLADVELVFDDGQSFLLQRWHIVLRTTVSEPVEYEESGNLCVLTETRCITEACDLPEMLIPDDVFSAIAINFSDESEAIGWCRNWYGR